MRNFAHTTATPTAMVTARDTTLGQGLYNPMGLARVPSPSLTPWPKPPPTPPRAHVKECEARKPVCKYSNNVASVFGRRVHEVIWGAGGGGAVVAMLVVGGWAGNNAG